MRLSKNYCLCFLVITMLMCVAGGLSLHRQSAQAAGGQRNSGQQVSGEIPEKRIGQPARLRQEYGRLPLRFERNQGQSASRVQFLARGSQYGIFLTSEGAVIQLMQAGKVAQDSAAKSATAPGTREARDGAGSAAETKSAVVQMRPVGASTASPITVMEELPTRSHYFIGNDPQAWLTDVKNYARIRYEAVWPGIDMEWYGNQQQLEYDFVVAPGADAKKIRLSFGGVQRMRVNHDGALELVTAAGTLQMLPPMAWQEIDGARCEVKCAYRLNRQQQVELKLGAYDAGQRLVIDPVLSYARVLGGSSNDTAYDIAVDNAGNAYVTGATVSPAFPGTSPVQSAPGGNSDAFVLKLNTEGSNVMYATWLGGSGSDIGLGIAADASGQVRVAGFTGSANFPVRNPLQAALRGESDAFIAQLNAAGSALVYSTYLGGEGIDRVLGMAVDGAGNTYLTGGTSSFDFPLATPFQNAKGGHGFYASSNAAGQWNASGNPGNGLNATRVNDLAIDPSAPATLYAATDQGVWKSVNSGTQWARVGAATLNVITQNVYIDPGNASRLYALSGAGVLSRSNNAGDVWQSLSLSSVAQLAITSANPTTVYAVASQGLSRSTDNGETWTQVLSPNQYGDISVVTVDPVTPATLYVGANRGTASAVYKSTDGGTTWQPASIGLISGAASRYNRLAISRSNPATLLIHVTPDVSSPFEQVYKTTNSGASWQSLPQIFAAPIRDIEIDPASPTTFYVATNGSGIYKSTDGGTTWATVNSGLGNSEVQAIAINPSNASNVYAGTDSSLEAFVAKLNPAGSALIYSSYLGASQRDYANAIAIDTQGNAYLTGPTSSPGFPTLNAYQSAKGELADAFVTKINPAGSALVWSTFLGGTGFDEAIGLAVNGAGNVYVTGQTSSTNFPTVNPYKAQLDINRRLDAFVTRFSANGSSLDFSTYFGGSGIDVGIGLALDAASNVYVAGLTGSSFDFPLVRPVQEFWNNTNQVGSGDVPNTDAFVSKFNPGGQSLLYSTWLGGRLNDEAHGIVADATGNVWVTGLTASENFPATIPYQSQNTQRGLSDLFIAKLAVSADLAVTLTDDFDPVMVNNDVIYRATITNRGPDTASGVSATITLPAGVTLISATPSQGTCNGATCTLGDLAENAQATVQFVARGNAAATISTSVSVTSSAPDLTTTNNTATQETKISLLPSIAGRVNVPASPPATTPQGLSNVTMTLSGGGSSTQVTRADGGFQFAELPLNGNYTVTPARQGYVFTPENRVVNNLAMDQRADFTATLCEFTLSAAGQSFSALGGTGSVMITAPDARCPWAVQSSASWVTVTSAVSGNGNATISFSVAPASRARVAALRIAGKVFTITQTFNPCSPPEFAVPQFFATNTVVTTLIGAPPFKAADFNGDGQSDLAYIATPPSSGAGALLLILSKSTGGYEPPAVILSNPVPTHFNTGDFNKDGRPDLAVSVSGQPNATTGTVQVLLNNGNGTFASPVSFTIRPGNGWITVTDVNADGNVDLAVSSGNVLTGPPPPTSRSVSIMIGNGAGSFGAATHIDVPIPTPTEVLSQIESGDFDGDGKTDLVTLGSAGGIAVLRGNGTGAFTVGTRLNQTSAGEFPGSIAAADFNGDGRTDLAHLVQSGVSASQLFIRQADGAGGFSAAVSKTLPEMNRTISAADVNRDNRADLIFLSSNGIGVLLANERGEFGEPTLYAVGTMPLFTTTTNRGAAITVTDFNRDGQLDVIVPVILGGDAASPSPGGRLGFAVIQGQGNGNFNASPTRPLTPSTTDTQYNGLGGITDLDGDGLTDFVTRYTRNGGFLTFNYSDGQGGFVPISTTPDPTLNFTTTTVLFVDSNRDGLTDYVTINNTDGKVQVYLNNGARAFTPQPAANYGQGLRVASTGDFTSDGFSDLLVTGGAQTIRLLVADGQGKFTERPTNVPVAFASYRLNAADFNGDGRLDLLVTPAPNTVIPDQTMRILTGDGQGNFNAPQEYGPASNVNPLLTPDLNRDGRSDLLFVFGSFPNAGISVAFARADGSFALDPVFNRVVFDYFIPENLQFRLISLNDLDGDGLADLILGRIQLNGVVWMRGRADGTFEAAQPLPFASANSSVFTGQFNQDSATDLLMIDTAGFATTVLSRGSCPPANWATTVPASNYSGIRPARESIVAAFGTGLSATTQSATSVPLPTTLSGVSVRITDSAGTERAAPLFFVSPSQINYQVPPGAVNGTAIVRVVRDGNVVSSGVIEITTISPGVFTADASGTGPAAAYVVRVKADNSQVIEPIVRFNTQQNRFETVPIDLSNAAEQVILVLFGSGIRGRAAQSDVTVRVGGESAQVLFAAPQGDLIGLDQVNVLLPRALAGRGEVDVNLLVQGKAANPVRVSIR